MKKQYGTMLVLCAMGLLVLSSGIALGVKGVDINATKNATDAMNATNATDVAITETPVDTQPTVTYTTVPAYTTTTPTATETEIVPTIPITTPKSPGFEIVLTVGGLSAVYILGKFGKRR